MNKLDVRIKKTYSQLIAGFFSVLKVKSFDDITVSEICECSNVHRATFYKHFNDKFEFLNFCFDYLLRDIDLSSLLNSPTPENIKESCKRFIYGIFEYINKYKYIFSTVFSSNRSYSFNYQLESMITSFCFEKFKLVLSDTPDYKIELLASFYSGAVIGAIRWYLTQDSECTLDDIYTFFDHRIDEIIGYYRNNLIKENN